MSAHTPGPWVLSERFFVMTSGEVSVVAHCDRTEIPMPEKEANARLIAAAPDLLAAAKRALPYLGDLVAMNEIPGPGDRLAFDALEAAIAKAEGK